jgi:hypothetical protein
MSREGESLMRPKTGGVADLRAQVRQIPVRGVKLPNHKIKAPALPKTPKPPKPPKPPKQSKHQHDPHVDRRDEAAERAEHIAQQQHSTSLLKGAKKPVYKEAKSKGGAFAFTLQLFAVILLCGGGAYLMDPNVQAQIAAIDWQAIKEQLKLDQLGIE